MQISPRNRSHIPNHEKNWNTGVKISRHCPFYYLFALIKSRLFLIYPRVLWTFTFINSSWLVLLIAKAPQLVNSCWSLSYLSSKFVSKLFYLAIPNLFVLTLYVYLCLCLNKPSQNSFFFYISRWFCHSANDSLLCTMYSSKCFSQRICNSVFLFFLSWSSRDLLYQPPLYFVNQNVVDANRRHE